ncbi:MAG: hypothetical protein K2N71_08310 [Oscillospiraceae bacterium]|nr:hypothetical protein [Oscillospiraceae bacterium]
MKRKVIFPIILLAMLLTACQEQSPAVQTEQTENSITAALEIETKETEAASETAETSAEADEKAEAAEIKGNTSSDYFDYFTFDLSKYEKGIVGYNKVDSHMDCILLSKNLLCSFYQYYAPDSEYFQYLRFYDIDKDEMTAEIPIPAECSFFEFSHEKIDDDNVLVKAYLISNSGMGPDGFGEITVYKDYSYDSVTEYGSIPYPGIDYYNTGIYANDPDTSNITNLRTNTTLFDAPNGIALYGSSIDENRFIFKNTEYDVGSYIGIYDYSTGNITEIPDSDNLKPIGYYDGKIYACLTNSADTKSENGVGEIFSFDIETLEKKNFMTFHTPDDSDDGYIICFMAQDCGYMSVVLFYNIAEETEYIISLDSGEILSKHELDPETEEDKLRDIMYEDGRVVLRNFFTDKLLVLDPKE